MNYSSIRRLWYLGAILLAGMYVGSSHHRGQGALATVTTPAGIERLSADGTAPPPPLPTKKPSKG
jgi:hypothetical protein